MNMLRPDELANQADVQRAQSFKNTITSGAKAALGASATSKILPFLNEYIPTDIAMKGISKLFPKIGEFLNNGRKMGLDVKEGLNFVKENLTKEDSKKQPAKENRNIIEQYSPNLFQFIKELVQKGQSPIAAGAIAQNKKEYQNDIKKMEKDHKTNWSNIIQGVFGSEESQPMQGQSFSQGSQQQMQQQSGNQTQSQSGSGQQALMAILQKIAQTRGGQ